jgi:hypothetical protein
MRSSVLSSVSSFLQMDSGIGLQETIIVPSHIERLPREFLLNVNEVPNNVSLGSKSSDEVNVPKEER